MLLEGEERAGNRLVVGQPAPQAVNPLVEALAWMDNPRERLTTVR